MLTEAVPGWVTLAEIGRDRGVAPSAVYQAASRLAIEMRHVGFTRVVAVRHVDVIGDEITKRLIETRERRPGQRNARRALA